jgi:hypothetical protein
VGFLAQCSPPSTAQLATPQHILQFLVWRDTFGKTVVHTFGCPLWGSRNGTCPCPKRAAYGSVDSLVGQLRAAFLEYGGARLDKPCASRPVHNYLRDVQFEQVRSRVQPKQAVPLFEDKLTQLVLFLNSLLNQADLDQANQFTLLRDRAFLALDLQVWKRGAELSLTLTDGILWFPDRSGWLFGYTWGKTLRTGDPHVFGLRYHSNQLICPLILVSEYVQFCGMVGVSLHGPGQFLFRPIRDGVVFNNPVSADTINRNFQTYLRAAGLFEEETLHGLRAGGAISAALCGDSLQAIMGQAHWSNARQALHYMRLQEVLGQGSFSPTSFQARSVTPAQYRHASTLQDFTSVFIQPGSGEPPEDDSIDPPAGNHST